MVHRKPQTAPKRSPGRPVHVPTAKSREHVSTLALMGLNQGQIGSAVGITRPTLEKHYRVELDAGATKIEARLVKNLLKLCNGDDGIALKAIIFVLQHRFGWSPYAPPRVRDDATGKSPPLGKKAAADREAQTAHEDSDWGTLLN